jgi:hypothetical protein
MVINYCRCILRLRSILLLLLPLLQTPFAVAGMETFSTKVQLHNQKTHINSLFFLFRLSFLMEFRCTFLLAAASGLVVIYPMLSIGPGADLRESYTPA